MTNEQTGTATCEASYSWDGDSCEEDDLYTFTSHTFTNCGKT